jgi:hypothetical protein
MLVLPAGPKLKLPYTIRTVRENIIIVSRTTGKPPDQSISRDVFLASSTNKDKADNDEDELDVSFFQGGRV